MEKDIKEKEFKSSKRQEFKKQIKTEELKKTKKLGPVKFHPPLPEFQRKHELCKNLRTMKTEGSILADRFHSLQKRNIIEPRQRIRYVIYQSEKIFCFLLQVFLIYVNVVIL